MNREERRSAARYLRRHAARLAQEYTADVLVEVSRGGIVARLDHPTAVATLRRAIREVLRKDGFVLELLSEKVANCFPLIRGKTEGTPWLGVGIDRDGCATWVTMRLSFG